MKKLKFAIKINASRQNVWSALWDDKTFRDWANIIDEGTYMVGKMIQGQDVQFISASSGYGVTSNITKLILHEYVLFRHRADTKDTGQQVRPDEWTGGTESYSLAEDNGVTTLTVESDTPDELEEIFRDRQPKALERVKILAEGVG